MRTVRKVGIFWKIGSSLVIGAEPMENVSPVGGIRDSNTDHYSYWEIVKRSKPDLQGYSYDYYPRGRIIARDDGNLVVVYADLCILRRTKALERIVATFGLTLGECVVLPDAHYMCHQCNKDYVSDM